MKIHEPFIGTIEDFAKHVALNDIEIRYWFKDGSDDYAEHGHIRHLLTLPNGKVVVGLAYNDDIKYIEYYPLSAFKCMAYADTDQG